MAMDVCCAAAAGIFARLLCHPLDTTKTVAFTGFSGDAREVPFPSASFSSSARSIWRREGFSGFYRGVGVAALGAAPGVALYLTAYAHSVSALRGWTDTHAPSLSSFAPHLASGFLAEAVSCVVWVPMDVTKERLQSQPPAQKGRYAGSWDALRTILRLEGLAGLYKGYWSTLASFGPYSAVYFTCYAFLLRWFREEGAFGTFSASLCAGGVGNVMASLLTNPLEFIKTRLQVQRAVLSVEGVPTCVNGFKYRYNGLVDGLSAVVREEGVRALWRGVGSRVAYAAPNAALTMAFYEWLRRPTAVTSQEEKI